MTGKISYVAYNRDSGDACFRSLLTPHSARTTVRAVPYINIQIQTSKYKYLISKQDSHILKKLQSKDIKQKKALQIFNQKL